jgi:regulator of sigma E protease
MGFILFYFILALIILITIHEFGHFVVARCFGVKVLRFSFGFGKVLLKYTDKRGTEYAWSLFPLGGYVKMLDESEGDVLPEEAHLAFNNQSVWVRIAIVLAGPLFNLLFAFLAIWLTLMIGLKSLAPIIEQVVPESLAQQAGVSSQQEIISFNGKKISSWHDFQYALMPFIGAAENVEIGLQSLKNGTTSNLRLPLAQWKFDPQNPDVLKSLGIIPFVPHIPPIVGEVIPDSPAALMGLHVDDKIITINYEPIDDWLMLVNWIKDNPGTQLTLGIQRNEQKLTLSGTVGVGEQNSANGFLGVKSKKVNWPQNWLRTHKENPWQAGVSAFTQTIGITGATFKLIGRLISGNLPLKTISGPVGIAQGAGDSGRSGIAYYLYFLALVSISLGVLNILPIPMLDGGHLLYYLIEIIRGRPLSESIRTAGVYAGLILLLGLMLLGLSNDISRLSN